MVENVVCVVDGSAPPRDVATLLDSLLPKAVEVVVLQVVPQLPYAWIAWPAFPDAATDLAKAWAYVSEVAQELQGGDCRVSTRVHLSLLSAAEMDRAWFFRTCSGLRLTALNIFLSTDIFLCAAVELNGL